METQTTPTNRHPNPATVTDSSLPAGFSFNEQDEALPLQDLLGLFHALDSQIRIHIIDLLSQRDHYVFELVEILGSSQPLVSQHLRVLKNSGLIDSSRVGRQVTYRLAQPEVLPLIATARNILRSINEQRKEV